MSESEESPAQRQARIRREKREAKIKAGGTDRLDRITRLSGRTPEMMRNESPDQSPSPSPAPNPNIQTQTPPMMDQSSDPAQLRAQEEFLRSMMRAQDPQGQGQAGNQQPDGPEDPMMKMLSALTGGAGLGGQGGEGSSAPPDLASLFSPEDIQNATGMPAWATGMFLGGKGKAPPTPAEQKTANIWNLIHIVFSILAGGYLLFMLSNATSRFGPNPPPPATAQNPFLVFVLGETLIHSTRILLKSTSRSHGFDRWYQILKDVGRDGSIVLFMLGLASWWNGGAS